MSANSPEYIITDAMIDAGLLPQGDTPDSTQYTINLRRLNDLVNLWQTQGIKLWLNEEISIPLDSGDGTYTIGPAGDVVMAKPLNVISALFIDSYTPANRRPLTILSWDDYRTLGQIAQTGSVNSIFVNKRQSDLEVVLWPIPDATAAAGTVSLLVRAQVDQAVVLTDEMNFPIEWRMALRWGLADELSTGQPESIMTRCQQRAQMYKKALEDFDVEDTSTRFAPNMQMSSAGFSRFR